MNALGWAAILMLSVGVLAIIPAFVGMMSDDHDYLVKPSLLAVVSGFSLGLVVLLFAVLTYPDEQLVAGRCYQAVVESSTFYTRVGTVMVPTTTDGIVLVEVDCR